MTKKIGKKVLKALPHTWFFETSTIAQNMKNLTVFHCRHVKVFGTIVKQFYDKSIKTASLMCHKNIKFSWKFLSFEKYKGQKTNRNSKS